MGFTQTLVTICAHKLPGRLQVFDSTKLDPACAATVAALEGDPFYRSITEEFRGDTANRRWALEQYFAYSIQEGSDIGRTVHLAESSHGVAVWLLPQSGESRVRAAREKRSFLESNLGVRGSANYCRIVEYMSGKAQPIVRDGAWYLSIVAVDPALKGRGCGQQLLAPTLAEAYQRYGCANGDRELSEFATSR